MVEPHLQLTKYTVLYITLSALVMTLFACDQSQEQKGNYSTLTDQMKQKSVSEDSSAASKVVLGITQFKQLEWTDLMPKEDLEAILNPPDYINEIEDGSLEDQITSQIRSAVSATQQLDPYQQALVSTNIVPEFDGQAVRVAGYIVPLEFDDELNINQFFLVPYFGACIHVPPPPPNQIIFVKYPKGLKVNALYEPFWISGVLDVSITENELGTSAYSMDMVHFEPYTQSH